MTDKQAILDLIERLEKEGPKKCWQWPLKTDRQGRGRYWLNGKLELAHRAVWRIKRGPIPAGKMLCHTCDNQGCVNPSHLYVGTHADNMRDMKDRKRYFAAKEPERVRELGRKLGSSNTWSRGAKNPKAKLTSRQAASIRKSKLPTKTLTEIYGVARTTIQRIRSGNQWRARLEDKG